MTAKPDRRPRAPSKEGATFDIELQRYVMPSERVAMSKQSKKSVTQRRPAVLEMKFHN